MIEQDTPIMRFANTQELNECIQWWQQKLFLTDWWIVGELVDSEDIADLAGKNSFIYENHCSAIKIATLTDSQRADGILKSCDEETVVHELLHLKYNLVGGSDDNGSYEQCYLDMIEHALLEQMAKSLISVKYNLSFDWWFNS